MTDIGPKWLDFFCLLKIHQLRGCYCITTLLWLTVSACRYRAMFDVMDMPLDWPAEVNYHEANAFCRWKGPEYRLPTEAEHNRMRGNTVSGKQNK